MSHAHNTNIARSRLGPPRFGRRGDSGGAGPVVTYLTPVRYAGMSLLRSGGR